MVERLSARSSGSLQQSTLPRADWVHMQRQRCVDSVSRLCSLAVQGGGETVGLHQLWKFFRVQRSTAESFQQEVSRSSKAPLPASAHRPPSSRILSVNLSSAILSSYHLLMITRVSRGSSFLANVICKLRSNTLKQKQNTVEVEPLSNVYPWKQK